MWNALNAKIMSNDDFLTKVGKLYKNVIDKLHHEIRTSIILTNFKLFCHTVDNLNVTDL